MTTTYHCGCGKTFEGEDPVPIPGQAPSYPECPDSPEARYMRELLLPDEERDLPEDLMKLLDDSDREHPVKLSPVNKPIAPSSWSAFKFKAPTEGEKAELAEAQRRREAQSRQERNEADANRDADQLLARIDAMIASGSFGKSANFPMDREYGTKKSGKPLSASKDTIARAAQKWSARAGCEYRPPKFKKVWNEYQANFEKPIVDGDPSQGKHNVHVTRE